MDDKTLKLASATPILAAVIKDIGCEDVNRCVDKTIQLINTLNSKL